MDFFEMNFSNMFLEKHGKTVYNQIIKEIEKEKLSEYNTVYIEIIFKIAMLSFFGMKDNEIKEFIEDFMPGECVNVQDMKVIHRNSIAKIQRNLKHIMNEIEGEE